MIVAFNSVDKTGVACSCNLFPLDFDLMLWGATFNGFLRLRHACGLIEHYKRTVFGLLVKGTKGDSEFQVVRSRVSKTLNKRNHSEYVVKSSSRIVGWCKFVSRTPKTPSDSLLFWDFVRKMDNFGN